MTTEQINKIYKVEDLLMECRKYLDYVMYYSQPLTDDEHAKYRDVYNTICKAMDKL